MARHAWVLGWLAVTIWLLSHLAVIRVVRGSVIVRAGNQTYEEPDLPAAFGPSIPADGITGLLLVALPDHACSEVPSALQPGRQQAASLV